MAKQISLLLISFDRPDDLLELLQGLARQTDLNTLEEVLILNNASSVSYAAVEKFISDNPALKIRYTLSDENLGVSRGRNKLMAEARGEQLLVLDDDILFTGENDLAKIAGVFDKDLFRESATAAITFRVIYHETKEQQVTAFPHKQYEAYKDKTLFLTSYFAGCAHLLKREVLAKTGLYPVDFFYGMEEYDLSYRIIAAGYSLGYDGSITFEHKESPKGRQPTYQKLSAQWVNKSKVAWRYLPRRYYLSTMFAWSVEYLKKTSGHAGSYFSSWKRALAIPFKEKRTPLRKSALAYLAKVGARLKY